MNRLAILAPNGQPAATGLVCGGCKHMRDRARVQQPGVPDLSAPVGGACRAVPPAPVVVMTQQGPQVVGSAYPPVLENNPACGLYQEAT